jgi:glycosyltransferase involved in cell wall biosynthesis
VIPNGFDTERLRPEAARGAAFRDLHGITADTTLVVTPTRALPEKAVPVAREAVEQLSATHPLTWLVADSAEVSTRAGLRMIGLGGMEQSGLHDAIRAADLVLLPSQVELFGNVTAEAMALGAVVVGAGAGATPEVIGDAGALFRAGDAADAAGVMAALMDDPARRARLGSAARERIARDFALRSMQEAFDALVRSV